MIRPRLRATLLLAALLTACAPAWAGVGHVNFFLGEKSLDKGDWEPFDNQAGGGVEVSFGKTDWPVLIAIDALGFAKQETRLGVDVTGSTGEFDIGVRKFWKAKNAYPYVGGGIGSISGRIEADTGFGGTVSRSDSAIGPWVGGGIFWRIGSRFNIGGSLRWSTADIEPIEGVKVDAGGTQLGLLLGWGWPATK